MPVAGSRSLSASCTTGFGHRSGGAAASSQRESSAVRGRVESVSNERALGHSNLVTALTHSLPTRKREQMNPDEIKIDHCYLMRSIHGRRIVVRVTKLLNMTMGMAASEDVQPGRTESLTMKPIMVRFVWRHANLSDRLVGQPATTAARYVRISCGRGCCL
jgi:hypothetical protein